MDTNSAMTQNSLIEKNQELQILLEQMKEE